MKQKHQMRVVEELQKVENEATTTMTTTLKQKGSTSSDNRCDLR